MMRLLILATTALAACSSTSATAPVASVAATTDPCGAAVTAVKALASRVSVGVTHEQYTAALGDTAVAVDASGCITTVDTAMAAYRAAAGRWVACEPSCSEANLARIRVDWAEAAAALP